VALIAYKETHFEKKGYGPKNWLFAGATVIAAIMQAGI
jgi:hypothetical protein